MRKLLFLLFVLTTFIVYAGDNTGYYQYMGSDDTIKSDDGRMFLLRKNCVFFAKDGISDKAKNFKIKPVNGGMKAPFILKVKNADGVFKKVANVTSRKLSVVEFVDVDEADSLLKIDEYDILFVPLSPQKGLLFNKTNDTIDIYCDGSFVCTIGAKANTLVNKSENNDCFNIVVRGKAFLPTAVTMTYLQSDENNDQGDVIVVVLLLVVVCVVLVAIFILKKRKKSKKNEQEKDDYNFIFDKNSFENDLKKLARSEPTDNESYKFLYQLITFPKDEEDVKRFTDNIEKDLRVYYKEAKINVNNINITEIIKNQLQEKNVVKLPVVFEYSKPEGDEKDWREFIVDRKEVWVKVISVGDFTHKVKGQDDNASATQSILSQNFEQSDDIFVNQVEIISKYLTDFCQILQTEQKKLSNAHKALDDLKGSIDKFQGQKNEWKNKETRLNNEIEAEKKLVIEFENKYNSEHNACEEVKGEKDILNKKLEEMGNETKKYKDSLVFYLSCKSFASKAVDLFDNVYKAENLATVMYNHYKKKERKDFDLFCYFMTRINCKYKESIDKIEDLHSVCEPELRMLSASGLVPKNGWIDKLLSGETDGEKQVKTLRAKLYRDLFETYCGVAVIMADEYSYTMRKMFEDIDKSEIMEFEKLSELLQKNVNSLGYKLNYARPFTLIDEYDNVKNTEFVDVNAKKDMIVEVKKMAVLYGTNKYNTEVSVQK